MFSPEGVYAAMMTPFGEDGKADIPEIRRMTEFIIDGGVDGLFPVSNVGEAIHLSANEKKRFIEAVADQANGRVKITPGICCASTDESVSLLEFCEDIGADGVVICPPYYFSYPEEVIYHSIAAVAKRSKLPVILYNIPKYTSPITPSVLARLLDIDSVTAMKDSSGSIADLLTFLEIAAKKKNFNILVGWEEMLASAMTVGAKGCMVASGGIFPEIMSAIYGCMKNGEYEKAARLQKIIPRATAEMKKVFFPYGYKLAIAARGFDMGGCKIEHGGTLEDEKKLIAEAVDEAISDFKKITNMNPVSME